MKLWHYSTLLWHWISDLIQCFIQMETFQCRKEGCNKVYKTKVGRKQHEEGPLHNTVPKYRCTCGKLYFSQSSLYTHRVQVHQIPNEHKCKSCGWVLNICYPLKSNFWYCQTLLILNFILFSLFLTYWALVNR